MFSSCYVNGCQDIQYVVGRSCWIDMGVKQRILDILLFLKIFCVLIIVVFVINFVVFFVLYWFEFDIYYEGLWLICSGMDCIDYMLDNFFSK